MLKLRRLKIEKFRSLARGAELSFSDGINVLLGQNGTGKTTLLELISMVVRSDFSALAKEEFAVEYELAAPEGKSVIVVVRNERTDAAQSTMPLGLRTREVFRSSAEVLASSDRRLLASHDTEHGLVMGDRALAPSGGAVSCLDPSFLMLIIGAVGGGGMSLLLARSAHRFDESLDLFRRATGGSDLVGTILVTGQRQLQANSFEWLLVPNTLLELLKTSYDPKKSDYAFTDKELDFLATLKSLMGFSSSELRVDVTEQDPDKESIHIGNLLFRFWWPDGTFITHDRLSYGQKRLLTFFYYLASNPDIVIADELVNGLHHRWITASIDALGQRQAFLTSQNPLLLDYIPITSADEARKSFVLCRGEPREGRPGWIWENMTEDDAQELFSAYEVGIEHVSEILQSRGLW